MIPTKIKEILIKLEENGIESYLVGGFVRDFLLNKETYDIDIAIKGSPEDIIHLFGISKKKIQYGSFKLKVDNYNIDITTFRKEKYLKNKLEITYSENLREDAKRRDFTINAIYMNKEYELIDPFHGREDLNKKILRTIGDAQIRIKEDPIRILRAIRFMITYDLKLDKNLEEEIRNQKHRLKEISSYKLKTELDKILLLDGFAVLKKYDLLKELSIYNENIIYIEDLEGLWVQIKTDRKYIAKKELKKKQKKINKLLNCGTISILDLYYYGYHICLIAASLLNQKEEVEKMQEELLIHSRKELAVDTLTIKQLSKLDGKEFGFLLKEIEEKIVLKELKNTKEEIEKYLKERK